MKKLLNLILSLSVMIAAVNPCAVKAAMTENVGTWRVQTGAQASYMTESTDNDGKEAVTFNVPNKKDNGWSNASNRVEFDYVLDEAITSGNVTVSYDFKTNASLQEKPRAAEIRFTDSENNASDYALSLVNTVKQPYIFQSKDEEINKFTTSDLTSNEWHSVSYSFYISDSGIKLKQAVIDNEDVNGVMSYTHNAKVKALKAIEFFFFGNKTNQADYELSVRNMRVTNGFDEIEVTSDIENNSENITANRFNLSFSHAVTDESVNAIKLKDGSGNDVQSERYGVTLAEDGKSAVITMKTSEVDSGKTYSIVVYSNDMAGRKSEILPQDFVVSFTFGVIEPTPVIVVSSDIEDKDVVPTNMCFKLSVDKEDYELTVEENSFDPDKIKLYDENDDEATDVTLEKLLHEEDNVIFVTAKNYVKGKTYTLKFLEGAVEGNRGELSEEYSLSFTTSESKSSVSGKWQKSFNKHASSIEINGSDISMRVTNDGTDGKQETRDAYTYTFDSAVTGKNVPVKVSYKFKANDALTQSESEFRFYPYEHGDKGGTCICVYYPYTKPMFKWDGIKFNLPTNTEALTANEWHEIEYLFLVDETNGFSMINAKVDGASTDLTYNKAATKQFGSIDFWFYATSKSSDNFELDIKDFSVISGADIIDVESEIQDGATNVSGKDMKLTFSEKLYFDGEIKDAIQIVDSENNVISSEKYSVTMSDNDTVAHITMNTDDRDSELTYKIFVDKSKVRGKYYSTLSDNVYISFTLPKINPKATLGVESELPQNSTNVTPTALKFNFVPLPNDRISDVSQYEIFAADNTDLNSILQIQTENGTTAAYIESNAVMSEDFKSFTLTLGNYDRYTKYRVSIPAGSIVGADGEIMKNDFTFDFETGETEKPSYKEDSMTYEAIINPPSRTSENGIDTYTYKNKKGASEGDFCYKLPTAVTNAEGPIEVSFKIQMNEAMVNANGNAMRAILTDSTNVQGFFTINTLNGAAQMTDWTNYVGFYSAGTVKAGITDDDPWYTIKFIIDVNDGEVKNRYAQLDNGELVDASAITNNKKSFGGVRFLVNAYPDLNGEYEDYVFRIKDVKSREIGALKGTVTTEDNKSLSLRFSYDVPYIFESDIVISEKVNGEWQEIKQPYSVADMDASDMKQINITVGGGGLAYNKDYRVTLNRKGITADTYVELKITDIDFKTKEYPDNVKADVTFTASEQNTTTLNCSITNLQSQTIDSAFVIIAGYDVNGKMVDKYCTNTASLAEGGNYPINNVTLSGEIKNVKVFIFRDDISFKIYHMPQSFEK